MRSISGTKTVALVLMCLLFSFSGTALANQFILKNQQWYLMTLPANADSVSIETLFSESLPIAGYGTTWTVYRFDRDSQNYLRPDKEESIKQGEGFWIIQTVAEQLVLNIPDDLPGGDASSSTACASAAGCFSADLAVSNTTVNWSLIGAPYSNPLTVSDLRLVSNDAGCGNGCTIARASELGYLYDTQYIYDSDTEEYVDLKGIEIVDSGQAIWVASAARPQSSTLSMLLPKSTSATDCSLFVASSGTDSASGTENDPLRSIQTAADIAGAGDVVCVLGDSYASERIRISNSGTPESALVIRALDGATTRGFEIAADYVTLDGFEVTSGGQDIGAGILIDGRGNRVVNNYVHRLGLQGIACVRNNPQDTPRCIDSLIERNRVAYINGYGIWIEGANNTVQENNVSRSFSTGAHDADGIRVFGKGHSFIRNYIHDIYESDSTSQPHSDCFQSYNSGTFPALENIVFESNVCSTDRHCIIISNVSGPLASNIVIQNNVCHSRIGSAGFFVGHDTGQDQSIDGIKIINNVVALDSGFYGIYSDNSRNLTVQNNILFGSFQPWAGEGTQVSRGFIERNNLLDQNPRYADPTNPDARIRYRISQSSPAIDAGANQGVTELDIIRNPRISDGDNDGSAIVDIGPYEW